MKLKIIFIAALFAVISTPVFAADFKEANAKYQAGDFKSALALYEELAKTAPSAPVYYNLANTHFRLGNKARAVLNYERAERMIPRDADVLWNLEIARSVLSDDPGSSEDTLFIFWLKKIGAYMTPDEWALLLAAGAAGFFIFCFLQFLFPSARPFLRFFQILFMIYIGGVVVVLALKWDSVRDPEVIVLDKEVYARFGPSKTETKAFLLHEGAKAKVLDQSRDWVYVDFGRKSSGWIPKTSCEII